MKIQGPVACWPPRYHQSWKSVGLVVATTLVALALLWNAGERTALLRVDRVPASTNVKRNPPRTLFVFLAGVEGTGHHFYEKLYSEQSKKLREIISDGELALQQDLLRLQTSLYNDAMPEQALFTGALAYKKKNVHPDGQHIFQSIVQQLNATNAKVLRWLLLADNDHDRRSNKIDDEKKVNATTTTTTAGTTFPIPLNAILVRAPVGMMSYPNYLLPSRTLQYPDLHLLYRACDAAQVSCGHVYLHRDPYDVIESTVVKRQFGTEDDQIVLYTTMMGVLRGQLIDHSNRSIGCLDFDHLVEKGRDDDDDLKRFLNLFDIEEQAFRNTYQPPAATNVTVSPYLQIYMDTFVETSRAVWETCTAVSHNGWFN